MTQRMLYRRRARKIPVLRTSSTDYWLKWAPARLKTMAVSSSWGRAARRPHRTRAGPLLQSISDVVVDGPSAPPQRWR